MSSIWPSYMKLLETGELARRAPGGRRSPGRLHRLSAPVPCRPAAGGQSPAYCRTGRLAVVSSAAPHHGEEDCLRGSGGSGTIFFSNCNLGCVFCQNYEISREGQGQPVTAEQLADQMLHLQQRLPQHQFGHAQPRRAADP